MSSSLLKLFDPKQENQYLRFAVPSVSYFLPFPFCRVLCFCCRSGPYVVLVSLSHHATTECRTSSYHHCVLLLRMRSACAYDCSEMVANRARLPPCEASWLFAARPPLFLFQRRRTHLGPAQHAQSIADMGGESYQDLVGESRELLPLLAGCERGRVAFGRLQRRRRGAADSRENNSELISEAL